MSPQAQAVHEIAARCAASAWVQAQPGLELAACQLAQQLDGRVQGASRRAEQIAGPGLGPVPRGLRQIAALQGAQLRTALGWLPSMTGRAEGPRGADDLLRDGVADVLRHHLSLLGPPGAEVARILVSSGSLVPERVARRLQDDPIGWDVMSVTDVARVTDHALPGLVRLIEPTPVGATPVLQTHRCQLVDGSAALVRVRRPGARRALLADARFSGTLAWVVEQVAARVRDAHPQGFVQLTVRQLLDELDLRNHAFNAIELGLAVETLGIDGVQVARPLPMGIAGAAALFEHVDGEPIRGDDEPPTDPTAVGSSLAAILVLTAVGRGVFHADPGPEHLMRAANSDVVLVGCPVLGRLTPELRRAGYAYLTSVLSGDPAGQVAAMAEAGAIPSGADIEALVADLSASGSLDPMALLGGDGPGALLAGLRDAVAILLRHRLRPPLDVVLLVRGLFALQRVLPVAAPGATLTGCLLPLLPRLPELAGDGL